MTVATMKLKPVNGFENELKRNLKWFNGIWAR